MNASNRNIVNAIDTAIRANDFGYVLNTIKGLSNNQKAAIFSRQLFDGKPLLHHAICSVERDGSLQLVKKLLKFATESNALNQVDKNGEPALLLAIKAGKECVDAFLQTKGVNWSISVDDAGNTPLAWMLENRDLPFDSEIFAAVLNQYPQALDRVNKRGENVLHLACKSGDPERVRACMDTVTQHKYKKDLSTFLEHRDGLGNTPLHVGFKALGAEKSEILWEYIRDKDGRITSDLLIRNAEGESIVSAIASLKSMPALEYCLNDNGNEQEVAICLLEQNAIPVLETIMKVDTPEGEDFMRDCGKLLIKNPERLVKILSNTGNKGSHEHLAQHWRKYFADEHAVATFFGCALAADNAQLGGELLKITDEVDDSWDYETSPQQVVSTALRYRDINKDSLGAMTERYMKKCKLDVRFTAGLVDDKITVRTLCSILQGGNQDISEAVCKKLCEKSSQDGISVAERVLDSCSDQEGTDLLLSAFYGSNEDSHVQAYGRAALKEEVAKICVKYAREGHQSKMLSIIAAMPSMVYASDPTTQKSILEVAADHGHTKIVLNLIGLHREIMDKRSEISDEIKSIEQLSAVSPKDAAHVATKYISSGGNIERIDAERILRNSAEKEKVLLADALEKIHPGISKYADPKVQVQRQDSVLKKYLSADTEGKKKDIRSEHAEQNSVQPLNDYGLLRSHIETIKGTISSPGRFKREFIGLLKNRSDFTKTAADNGTGHSLFTLVALFGTPEQMDMLVSAYNKKSVLAGKSPIEGISSLGSPIQVAIQAGNNGMAQHLVGLARREEICTPRGYSEENILHTIVKSSALDFLYMLPHTRSNSTQIREALTQRNTEGLTPLDVAIAQGESSVSALLAYAGGVLSPEDVEKVIASGDFTRKALSRGSTALLEWVFDTAQRYNLKNAESGSDKRIEVLGSNKYEEFLVREACDGNNPDVIRLLSRKILERIEQQVKEDLRNGNDNAAIGHSEVSRAVSEKVKDLLGSLVRSGIFNQELYSSLIDRAGLSTESYSFLVENAFSYDNVGIISHIPYRDVAYHLQEQHLDKLGILLEGKDNLLAYIIENSSPNEVCGFDRRFVHALMAAPRMHKAKSAYSTATAGIASFAEAVDLNLAITAGNLRHVQEILTKNPSLIAVPYKTKPASKGTSRGNDPGVLPYDYAIRNFKDTDRGRELVKYLAHKTISFALNEIREEKERGQNSTDRGTVRGGSRSKQNRRGQVISPESKARFSAAVVRSLVDFGSEIGIGTSQINDLDRHIAAVAGSVFEEDQDAPNSLLRAALSKKGNELIAEKLVLSHSEHTQRIVDRNIASADALLNPDSVDGGVGTLYVEADVYNLEDTVNKKVNGRSLLHLAAENGTHTTLDALLMLGGNPSITTENGENIVHLCASSGMRHNEGGYVFEKLVSENSVLNTIDSDGKGVLAHAARCPDPVRTVEMLKLIVDRPELDAKLHKTSPKKRADYVEKELVSANANRADLVINDFIEENVSPRSKKSGALDILRKSGPMRANDPDKLSDTLVHESAKSFREINPLHVPPATVSERKSDMLGQQDYLFDLIHRGDMSAAQNKGVANSIATSVYTLLDPNHDVSPIEFAIKRRNVEFVKYFLEQRSGEINPNITDNEGNNLPVQLGKMLLEDPAIANDRSFIELYKSLLETCGCTTRSANGVTVQTVLGRLNAPNAELLRSVAADAADREFGLRSEFETELRRMGEGFSNHVVQRISVMSRTDAEYARNSANPFRSLFNMILQDRGSLRGGISKDHHAYIEAFIKDGSIRNLLKNVDEKGNNPLQSALQDLTSRLESTEIGVQRANLLQDICLDVAERLEREDPALMNEVFLQHKNCKGTNFMESLVSVSPSYELFRMLETKLTKRSIAEHSDMNTILARSSGQSAMQRHIFENYAVFYVGDRDMHGESRMHNAIMSGNHDAVLTVINTGGNINQLDSSGNTPLHNLLINLIQNRGNIKEGHIKTIDTLVSHGAPLHHRNNDGFTVCDIAKSITGPMFGKKRGCLELVADSRLKYHKLKDELRQEVERKCLTHREGRVPLLHCDISGSRLSLGASEGSTIVVSKLLLSDVCSNNGLSSASLSFNDGKDQGTVDKVGNKRNYVSTKGVIKLDLTWKPKTGGKVQKVTVEVKDDGSICVHESSIRSCGEKGENLDFNNCQVYVGGYPLADALRMGRWRAADREIDELAHSPDMDHQNRMEGQDRTQDDPSQDQQTITDAPDLGRDNAQRSQDASTPEGDGMPMYAQVDKGRNRKDRSASADLLDDDYCPPVPPKSNILRTPKATVREENLLRPSQGSEVPAVHASVSVQASMQSDASTSTKTLLYIVPDIPEKAHVVEKRAVRQVKKISLTTQTEVLLPPDRAQTPTEARLEPLRVPTSTSTEENILDTPLRIDAPAALAAVTVPAAVNTDTAAPEGLGGWTPEGNPQATSTPRDKRSTGDSALGDGTQTPERNRQDASVDSGLPEGDTDPIAQRERPPVTPKPKSEKRTGTDSALDDITQTPERNRQDASVDSGLPEEEYLDQTEILVRAGRVLRGMQDPKGLAEQQRGGAGASNATRAGVGHGIDPDGSGANRRPMTSPEREAWKKIALSGVRANALFALNIPRGESITPIAKEIGRAYGGITLGNHRPEVESSLLKKAMQEILARRGIEYKDLGHPTLSIKNGVILGDGLPKDFTSPYGFGPEVDGIISNALKDIDEISRRSSLDFDLKLDISHLPLLASAVNNVKKNPGGMELPNLGEGDNAAIPQKDGINILKAIANMAIPAEPPTIAPSASITSGHWQEKAKSFSEVLRLFKSREKGNAQSASARNDATNRRHGILDADSDATLYDVVLAVLAERGNIPYSEEVVKGSYTEAPRISSKAKEGSDPAAQVPQEVDVQNKVRRADRSMRERADISYILAPKRGAQELYQILSLPHQSTSDVKREMSLMMEEADKAPERSELCSWAVIHKCCSDAKLAYAFHSMERRNVVNAAKQMVALYTKLSEKDDSHDVISKALADAIPGILEENGIEYCSTGNRTLTVKNGVLSGNDAVPAHFSSPLGFGNYLDAGIKKALQDMGRIGNRAALNHTIVVNSSSVLPKIEASVRQVIGRAGKWNFDIGANDFSPIPQQDGKRLLTHLSNMYLSAGGGKTTISPITQHNEVTQLGVLTGKKSAVTAHSDKEMSRLCAADALLKNGQLPAGIGIHEEGNVPLTQASGLAAEIHRDVQQVKRAVETCVDGMKGVKLPPEEAQSFSSATPSSPSRASATREPDAGSGRAR